MSRTSLLSAAKSILPSLLCLLIGCSRGHETGEIFLQDLGKASEQLEVGQALRMDTVNQGEWNRMFVFPPYTPDSAIEAAINMKASSAIQSARVSERDDINLLVFLNGENIQVVAAVPRQMIDFAVAQEVQPLSRSHAVFKKAGVGQPLVLAGH